MATLWVPFLGGVTKLLERIEKMQGATQQQRDAAYMAILTASSQTRGYLMAIENGKIRKTRDIEREHALSNLWDICAHQLERFDEDLARRCRLKGDYWRNPDDWTNEDVAQTRIGLDRVRREAEYLLKLKIRPVKAATAIFLAKDGK